MKILVPIKRVPDYQAKVKLKADGSAIETDGIKWIVNPFDEIAVEEALKLKEAGTATEVIVCTVGPDDAATQLRYAMAMGADSGIHVKCDGAIDSEIASKVLLSIVNKISPKLVIMGKQSIDSDANQTGQLLAERLNWPQGCFASKVTIEGEHAIVVREVDGGLETLKLPMPCIITTDLRLNQPRYASLPGIMKAKKKPMEEIALGELSLNTDPVIKIKSMSLPPKRSGGRKVADVAELITALKEEAKVL